MDTLSEPSLFAQAAEIFDGWTDSDNGARVLKLHDRGPEGTGPIWSTIYHQSTCFLEGGRKVLLRSHSDGPKRERGDLLLDLTTGETSTPWPANCRASEVCDGSGFASLNTKGADDSDEGASVMIWDIREQREVASFSTDDGAKPGLKLMGDGRRAVVSVFRRLDGLLKPPGPHKKPTIYERPVHSQHFLLAPGAEAELILEEREYFCNHIVGCPANPELYAYDRWPTPKRDVDQVIHLHSLDGSIHHPVPLDAQAMRPADMWGVRDHFVWTPDGARIVSYLSPEPIAAHDPNFNHYDIPWTLSALDVRTGEDLAALYPPGRWGGHMQVSPDSKYIVCAGATGYDKLFAVSIEGLRDGWNERLICNYPAARSVGTNADPFAYPYVLPDQSGVIFTAGWPGAAHGVYLAEWPADLH